MVQTISILLIGTATLSLQNPIIDNTADQIVYLNPEDETYMSFIPYRFGKHFKRRPRAATPEDYFRVLKVSDEESTDDLQSAQSAFGFPRSFPDEPPLFPDERTMVIKPESQKVAPTASMNINYDDRSKKLNMDNAKSVVSDDSDEIGDTDIQLDDGESRYISPVYRYVKQSIKRSVRDLQNHQDNIDDTLMIRSKRSADQSLEDLDGAEVHIFKPYFRYKVQTGFKRNDKNQQNNKA